MSNSDELIQHHAEDPFEQALQAELRWTAPSELTAQLLALVPSMAVPRDFEGVMDAMQPPFRYRQPVPRYQTPLLVVTAIVVGFSLAIAWQIYSLIGAQLGLEVWWYQVQVFPDLGIKWLYDTVPPTRYIGAVFSSIRDQLHWLLIAAILWLALDGWTPPFLLRRQSSS